METTSKYNDRELFARIAEGDEKAFTELFHFYTPKLLPFVNKLTRNQHTAQEMIQETFLRIWIKREELGNIQHPAAWIYRVASNVSITWLKTQSNRRRLLEEVKISEIAESLSDKIDSNELDLVIRKAVSLLPEKRQEVYRLSREAGLSHQQIAEKLNLSPNTVKNQIGMSLKFIQEVINKETGLSMFTIMLLFSQ